MDSLLLTGGKPSLTESPRQTQHPCWWALSAGAVGETQHAVDGTDSKFAPEKTFILVYRGSDWTSGSRTIRQTHTVGQFTRHLAWVLQKLLSNDKSGKGWGTSNHSWIMVDLNFRATTINALKDLWQLGNLKAKWTSDIMEHCYLASVIHYCFIVGKWPYS